MFMLVYNAFIIYYTGNVAIYKLLASLYVYEARIMLIVFTTM